jgi:hypothetical protein
MGLLASVVQGVFGIVGSIIGAMTLTELNTFMSVVRRWMARIGLALWPDVAPDDGAGPPQRRGRARSKRSPRL